MNKENTMSFFGKVVAVVSAVFAILMISGKWLNLYQIPMIFGDSIPHRYSLFDISDFLDIFNMYLDNSNLGFYVTLFSVGATIAIILNVTVIIFSLVNFGATKTFAGVAAAVGIIIAVVFLGAVHQINAEMKEATYGGVEKLLKTTSSPYWLIVFSILQNVGCRLKSKGNNTGILSSPASAAKRKCLQCGAEIGSDSVFCNSCGAKVETQESNNKFCTECGAEIPADAAFCTKCGCKLV